MGPRVIHQLHEASSPSKNIRWSRLDVNLGIRKTSNLISRRLLILISVSLVAIASIRNANHAQSIPLIDSLSTAAEDYGHEIWPRRNIAPNSIGKDEGQGVSVIDRYLQAMNDPSEYHDSDFPFTPAVQRALYRHQHPPSCANSKFLIYYVWSHGLGSFVRGMSSALALAVSQGRILLLAVGPPPTYKRLAKNEQVWKTWHHGIGCTRVHPECFFKPISNCSLENVHKLMMADVISYAELENDVEMPVLPGGKIPRVLVARGKLNWLVGVRRALPVTKAVQNLHLSSSLARNEFFDSGNKYVRNRMWSIQAYVYLLRLNKRMQTLVRPAMRSCFQFAHPEFEHIIGLPVRRSDKCYRNKGGSRHGEAQCVSLEETIKFASRIHASQPWVDTILVTSEDKSVLNELSRMRALTLGSDPRLKWNVLTNTADVQQGTGKSFSAKKVKLDNSGGKKGHSMSPANITESMLTTIACQALPSHHVLLLHSNFADTIDLLSKAVPGRRSGVTINAGSPTFPS